MKIATYNVNGVNGRLSVLLRWLAEEKPDVVCLQELKAPQEKFPNKRLPMLVITLFGMDNRVGTASRYYPKSLLRKSGAVCLVTPKTNKADILKQ